jgi:HK97 gp10 family phage protein
VGNVAFGIRFAITGDAAILRRLHALPRTVQSRILRPVLRDSLRPMLADAKQLAPKEKKRRGKKTRRNPTGTLRRGIVLRKATWTKGKRGVVAFEVFVSRETVKNDAWYGGFVERGHKIKRGGAIVGKARPVRFLRRAFLANRASAKSSAMRAILRGVLDAVKGN